MNGKSARASAKRSTPSRLTALLLALVMSVSRTSPALAANLIVDIGRARDLTTAVLLKRPDVRTITVPLDATYGRTMTYRAVPLRALLGVDRLPSGQVLRVVAADGFVIDLPASLVFPENARDAQPWVAVEPADKVWPRAPGGQAAGPFYLVWLNPAASGVLREQWPFAIVRFELASAVGLRWPQLAIGKSIPVSSPVRRGQSLTESQCMTCHQVAGPGDAMIGRDLNRPRSPTEYFQPWALRSYLRDPASLRTWPDRRMPGFPKTVLSDGDVDTIVAYLDYLAEQRPK